ncbi:hypothetical protein N7533_012698 [Penicillium manginii]|uniref:uncharacterized protein n=1 Tax=Penicillium manginii TaxID=203109 RepID=UPI002549634C|nr:uncharacterized protein N7533_012698 [Penicillium manginii]KAJ5739914.1 hypothetical protein N7533_012698 [Penicillium manginii]
MDIITSNTTSMPIASTLSGFTFENWGPVTTTFTPPSSCITASNKIEVGPRPSATHSGPNKPIYAYNLQCETIGGWECYPSATVEASTTPDTNPTQFFRANYYSPGLYCPHDWVTVGLASWDGDADSTSLVTSGIFVPTTTAEIVPRGRRFWGFWERVRRLLLVVRDYKPSSGCNWIVPKADHLGISTVKTIINGTSTTRYLQTLAATSPFLGPTTTTFDAEEKKTLVGMAVNPMITLVHKKADFDAASPTSTNHAARLSPGSSSWGGLGSMLGISVAAMALGAVFLFP